MVKIRLARTGVRRKPFYRIVAIDEKQRGEGIPLETVGYWHPAKDVIKIDAAKLKAWVAKGAKITKAVTELIKKHK